MRAWATLCQLWQRSLLDGRPDYVGGKQTTPCQRGSTRTQHTGTRLAQRQSGAYLAAFALRQRRLLLHSGCAVLLLLHGRGLLRHGLHPGVTLLDEVDEVDHRVDVLLPRLGPPLLVLGHHPAAYSNPPCVSPRHTSRLPSAKHSRNAWRSSAIAQSARPSSEIGPSDLPQMGQNRFLRLSAVGQGQSTAADSCWIERDG